MTKETCLNLARISLVTVFAALLCGCCLNAGLTENPQRSAQTTDRTTKMVIGLIPVAITVVGLACGSIASIVAVRKKYEGVLLRSIPGVLLNLGFLAFVVFTSVAIAGMVEEGRLPVR